MSSQLQQEMERTIFQESTKAEVLCYLTQVKKLIDEAVGDTNLLNKLNVIGTKLSVDMKVHEDEFADLKDKGISLKIYILKDSMMTCVKNALIHMRKTVDMCLSINVEKETILTGKEFRDSMVLEVDTLLNDLEACIDLQEEQFIGKTLVELEGHYELFNKDIVTQEMCETKYKYTSYLKESVIKMKELCDLNQGE